jgi:hypothetical protein
VLTEGRHSALAIFQNENWKSWGNVRSEKKGIQNQKKLLIQAATFCFMPI